jgi:hypothetical protein
MRSHWQLLVWGNLAAGWMHQQHGWLQPVWIAGKIVGPDTVEPQYAGVIRVIGYGCCDYAQRMPGTVS